MKTEEEIREDVLRWFRQWRQTASDRLCVLLVAGYFRTRGPFGVEGEEKYLQLRQPHGLALVELVEESADRRFTSTEAREFGEQARLASQLFRRDALVSADQTQFDPVGVIDCLRIAQHDPRAAPDSLLRENLVAVSYPALQQVRECLCPPNWLAAPPGWNPPQEAVNWAQRIYDQRAFSELPILADLLEDADCPDRPLLDHCRHCKAHFRGCAALDRLLGKA